MNTEEDCKMTTVLQLPEFTTTKAKGLWLAIPAKERALLLINVYCGKCRDAVRIVNFKGRVSLGDLVIDGYCEKCNASVTRVIEKAL